MPKLKTACLDWQGNVPRAQIFDEIYYAASDGLAESRYVYCDALSDEGAWWQRPQICIGEAGFGTGLNFLTTWQKWQQLAPQNASLHYVAAEAYPMTRQDIFRALSNWPELSKYSGALVDAYPVLHPGFHRLYFESGRVSLTLMIGDASQMFAQLQAQIDGWYLDGFTPAKNPDMWTDDLFNQIVALSTEGAKLATFTAASAVGHGLEAVGFDIQKREGFNPKRECLQGTLKKTVPPSTLPWFAPSSPLQKGASIAIIGGGIAGVSCYHAALLAGFKPTLIEKESNVAMGGSGNPVGLIQPRLTTADSLDGQFNATAYLNCIRYYDDLEKTLGEKLWHGARGGIQLARNEDEEARYQKLVAETRLPNAEMCYLDATEMSEKAGIDVKKPGLYYANAGALKPKDLLPKLAEDIDVVFNSDVTSLQHENDQWHLLDHAGEVIASADAVILANAHEAQRLTDIRNVPLTAKRGQTSFLPANSKSKKQRCGLSFGSYVTPVFTDDDGRELHVVGASYRALEDQDKFKVPKVTIEDHQENFASLAAASDCYAKIDIDAKIKGRAAIRATTIDHLPVVGPVHLGDEADQMYHDLRHGKAPDSYPKAPYQPRLYCMTGLGSRGFQTAPLLATALCDMLAGSPNALEKRFLDAIHPIRFQIRKLKRKRGR